MIGALIDHQDVLRTSIQEHASENQDAQGLLELSGRQMFKNYLDLLKPVACMVLEAQAEKEPTANRIIENLAAIWLHLKEKNQQTDGSSAYSCATAQAAKECFTRKIGDLSQDWLSTPSCSINKKLAVCGAFLDPFTHSQLKDICSKMPGLNYDTMKRLVCEESRRFANPTRLNETPTKKARQAKFICDTSNAVEKEVNLYAGLPLLDEEPLEFWKKNHKLFTNLAPLAKLILAVQASSSASERAFKELRAVVNDYTRNKMETKGIASLIMLRKMYIEDFIV